MDANTKRIMHIKVKETVANLEKHNFKTTYVNTKEEALTLVKTLVPEGSYTAMGGSMTLEECGIASYIREKTDFHKDYRDAYSAQYYFASANAITMHGEIYEVDGTGNRVSAIIYGPEKVILVAGINKLVPTMKDAVERVKSIASPANATRLCKDTPCTKLGHCMSEACDDKNLNADGCLGNDCICCTGVTLRKHRFPDRVIVIIVGEDLGY